MGYVFGWKVAESQNSLELCICYNVSLQSLFQGSLILVLILMSFGPCIRHKAESTILDWC